jgi:hypothetical protein
MTRRSAKHCRLRIRARRPGNNGRAASWRVASVPRFFTVWRGWVDFGTGTGRNNPFSSCSFCRLTRACRVLTKSPARRRLFAPVRARADHSERLPAPPLRHALAAVVGFRPARGVTILFPRCSSRATLPAATRLGLPI